MSPDVHGFVDLLGLEEREDLASIIWALGIRLRVHASTCRQAREAAWEEAPLV